MTDKSYDDYELELMKLQKNMLSKVCPLNKEGCRECIHWSPGYIIDTPSFDRCTPIELFHVVKPYCKLWRN